ncbi:hypothetical protein J2T14_004721 [Paenibacillus harenae]|nr:hypothetical protein [Paenibacillus harenae]
MRGYANNASKYLIVEYLIFSFRKYTTKCLIILYMAISAKIK